MTGITFGDKHSFDDFGLWLSGISEPPPLPNTSFVEIPGQSGALDMSESLAGHITYGQRTCTYIFTVRAYTKKQWDTAYNKVVSALHGRRMDFAPDIIPDYHFTGRLAVSGEFVSEEVFHEIRVTATADPFRLKNDKTVVSRNIIAMYTITLQNGSMPTVPTFNSSATCQITFGSATYSIPAGNTTIHTLVLMPGENVLQITGTTNLTITFQEGEL